MKFEYTKVGSVIEMVTVGTISPSYKGVVINV